MITNTIITNSSSWKVSYSIFVDDLRVFDVKVITKPESDLRVEKNTNYSIIYDKYTDEILLIDIRNASKKVSNHLDKLSKDDIIRLAKEYINER